MKMQIWKVYVSEGVMGAIHGQSFPVYEGFVPDLKLTINRITSFVHDDDDNGEIRRYQAATEDDRPLVKSPDPELICEVKLTCSQIEDMKMLANPDDNPEERAQKLVASVLKEHKIDASEYEDDDDDDDDEWNNPGTTE